jgi:hypothetical protein
MQDLKFELSVLFTKTDLSPLSNNEEIEEGYRNLFGKEVDKSELLKMIDEIINDQVEYNNGFLIEIPEDYELRNTNDI